MYLCKKFDCMENSIKTFKFISLLEGISFLVLLGIAMPLKYIWHIDLMVKYVGWAHGLLFVLYIGGALYMFKLLKWTYLELLIVVMCSVLPFGPFYAERKYLP